VTTFFAHGIVVFIGLSRLSINLLI